MRFERCLLEKGRLRRDLVITQSRAGAMNGVLCFGRWLWGVLCDPQAAVVPVLVCPSVGAQMLSPGRFASSYKDGTCREWLGKDTCQAK